jgi:pimeloyl-ACP methyl ester carboxylesterase
VKEINRRVLSVAVALILVVMLATPLLSTVEACGFGRKCKKTLFCGTELTATDQGSYIEYVGALKGASFVLRIPDKWNGMLVIGCHGYQPSISWKMNPQMAQMAQFAVDNLVNGDGVGLPFVLVDQGYAYAASSYGEGGWAISKGMSSTVQLTLFSLNMLHCQFKRCNNIKTYLVGHSMGGAIALMLGATYPKRGCGVGNCPKLCCGVSYPKLYDGVLDISGMKDIVMGYNDSIIGIANITSIPPPIWNTFNQTFQNQLLTMLASLKNMTADMEVEYGGTYFEKPEAYERTNPVDNAKIHIPMITVNGAADPLTSEAQGHSFEKAVAEAGCSKYYKLYTADPPAAHANPPTIDAALLHFEELVGHPFGWRVCFIRH